MTETKKQGNTKMKRMFGAYTWRGKTYKTIGGLHSAAMRHYPGCGITFEKEAMVLSGRNAVNKVYLYFRRSFDADHDSIIEAQAYRKETKTL